MRILIATPELAEIAPVGGLAEHGLGLATALLEKGHDVRVFIPFYSYLHAHPRLLDRKVEVDRLLVRLGPGRVEACPVFAAQLRVPARDSLRLTVLMAGPHRHFASVTSTKHLYEWPDHEPWVAFGRSVVDYVDHTADRWQPDVIHVHDAHTSVIPIYIAEMRKTQSDPRHWSRAVRTVLTVHNLQDKGDGDAGLLKYAGLPEGHFHPGFLEFYGRAAFLKGGLLTSDRVITGSPTYAEEICSTHESGSGLEGVMDEVRRAGRLTGISNGIDPARWTLHGINYKDASVAAAALAMKAAFRVGLYPKLGWQETGDPIFAFRGGWDSHKGIELLCQALPTLLRLGKVAIVTWAYPGATAELTGAWGTLKVLECQMPGRLSVNSPALSGPENTSAHYTLADFMMLPSRSEPCGLAQLECQRYGAIPIVRRTGGLADTVFEQPIAKCLSPNGLVFERMAEDDLVLAAERAVKLYGDRTALLSMVKHALQQENGWGTRMEAYEQVYRGSGGPESLRR